MTDPEIVALTALSRELTALTGMQPPSYRKLWSLTVDGRVPAKQVNGRWEVRRADLPSIAAMLGLQLKAIEPAPKSRKGAAAVTANSAS